MIRWSNIKTKKFVVVLFVLISVLGSWCFFTKQNSVFSYLVALYSQDDNYDKRVTINTSKAGDVVNDKSHVDKIAIQIADKIPDFKKYKDVNKRKKRFLSYMVKLVNKKNKDLLVDRERLQKFLVWTPVSKEDNAWIRNVGVKYLLPAPDDINIEYINDLLDRVDVIPPSLVLAQSAIESGWGTSRFAVDGNNLFGQWCYKKGCGLVPRRREEGASYEVRAFTSVTQSVDAYFLNLNSNSSYDKLRILRKNARESNGGISGLALLNGLGYYSERGDAYINDLNITIKVNELTKYDDH